MKTILYYEAEDGKIFKDKDECVAYEFDLQMGKVNDKIKVWDEYQEPIHIQKNADIEKIWYIKIDNVEQCEIIDDLHEKAGLYAPFDGHYRGNMVGLWWYDGEGFINLTEKVAEYQEIIDKLQ